MKIFKAFLILIFSFIFLSCSTTLYRAMTRGDAGVDDYLYFPERKIAAGGVVREIKYEPDFAIEDRLEELFETSDLQSFIDKTKTQALLVVRGDSLVFEAYGKDYDRESVVTSFSVAKSFVCAIVGVLLQQGKIKSVDQPVTDFIPELIERDKRFSKIRLCDLLSMSSGIAYSERAFDDTKTYYDPDLRKLTLTKTKIKSEPDTEFLYNNYNPLLLGIVIERASGTSVSAFLEKYIWKPMGAEFDASWSLDSIEDGFEKMESGINTLAMDFVRFACMYRDGGKVFGKQVVSQEWIKKSIATQARQIDYYSDHWGKDIFNHGASYGLAWYVFAGFALVVAISFAIIFKYKHVRS